MSVLKGHAKSNHASKSFIIRKWMKGDLKKIIGRTHLHASIKHNKSLVTFFCLSAYLDETKKLHLLGMFC